MHRLMRKIRAAVFHGRAASNSPQTRDQSPVKSAGKEFERVAGPDAVAELSYETGDPHMDLFNATVISCIQCGFLDAYRDGNGLRFKVTDKGQAAIDKAWPRC